MELKTKLVIVGKSGSGKDSLADEMTRVYGLKKVTSYTTREMRESERGFPKHIHTTKAYFQSIDKRKVAVHVHLYGNDYWTTKQQLDDNDMCILDIKSAKDLKERYGAITIVYIECAESLLRTRLSLRGDRESDIETKLCEDRCKNKNSKEIADIVIENTEGITITELASKLVDELRNKNVVLV